MMEETAHKEGTGRMIIAEATWLEIALFTNYRNYVLTLNSLASTREMPQLLAH